MRLRPIRNSKASAIVELIVVLVTLAVVPAVPTKAMDSGFEVDGLMTIIPKRGKAPKMPCFPMHLFYRDCQWQIVSSRGNSVFELGDDARNIYMLVHPTTNVAEPHGAQWAGMIAATGFPRRFCSVELESILFYAYFSSCYLDSASQQMIDSIWLDARNEGDRDKKVKAEIHRNSDALKLPSRITFFRPDGVKTNAVLVCSSFTNMGAGELPLQVQLFVNSPNGIPATEYSFRVNHIRNTCSLKSFQPPLSHKTLIQDYRFTHDPAYAPPLYYSSPPSNDWPNPIKLVNF